MRLSADLNRCPLFQRLAPAELERVAEWSRRINLREGEMAFREGQPCEGFYIVTSGSVRLFKIGPEGRERTLHLVHPPHSFAEAAMFGRGVYPATCAALEETRLILVYRDPFLRMIREQPDFALRVFESLSHWLHCLLGQLENEAFLNARAKLASYLLREVRNQSSRKAPSSIELNQPKKNIASSLGMAPETFSRAQADLESRGLIRITGRKIEIPDPGALERILLLGKLGE